MVTLETPLKGVVGPAAAPLEKALGLRTVGDLLRHYPRRYDERGEHTDLATLEIGDQVTLMAQVQRVTAKQMKQRRGSILEVLIGDGIRTITATFFNQPWRERELKVGKWGLFAGKVTEFREKRQLNGPEYVLLDPDDENAANEIEEFAGAIIPVYPAAAGLPTWTISRCVRLALEMVEPPPDPLPSALRAERKLVGLDTALRDIHRPASKEALYAAKKRLKWDEAFALQVTLVQRKQRAADWPARARPGRADGLLAAFDKSLPYTLTNGQVQVGAEIAADMAAEHPMHRLLQGDVGAGKTLVALRAILQVVDSGGQAALLAPTEVLAGQHHRGIVELLGPLAARADEKALAGMLGGSAALGVELLTGSLGVAARRRVLAGLSSGETGLIIGTHALLSEGVDFADLGLVVVDEQHRFGVEQRDILRAKADQPPHTLVMTATPIPRTVAMTVYGDLEVSALTELPAGRSPIATHVVPMGDQRWLDRAWARVREEVGKGHQAYVVCPRIGDEEPGGATDRRPPLAVLDVAPELAEGPLKGLRVEILHGRMPAEDKDSVMRAYAAGDVDVLVATTVIEVGVNVPNATMMVILDAERFGVSQLHQLRGRVGRGSAPGLCLLVSEAVPESPSGERLAAVASTTDGFRLAELDLEQRREGDVLGAAQSGKRSAVRLLSVIKDADLITEARAAATALLAEDLELERHPVLAATVATLVAEDRAEYLEKG